MIPPLRTLARAIWRPADRGEMPARMEDYLRRRAAPRLGLDAAAFQLDPVRLGRITFTRRWHAPGGPAYYVRAWPWDPRLRPARHHETVSGLISGAGVSAPSFVLADDSLAAARRWGIEVSIEEESAGEPFTRGEERAPASPERLARDMAKIHAIRGKRWGRPWVPSDKHADPRAYWTRRLGKFRRDVRPGATGLGEDQIREGLASLERRLAAIRWREPRLVHGDVNPANVLAGPGSELTWIDFDSSRFELPELDLASIRLRFYRDGAQFERFMAAYEAEAAGGGEIDGEAVETFGLLVAWRKVQTRTRLLKRREENRARGERSSNITDEALIRERAGYEKHILDRLKNL